MNNVRTRIAPSPTGYPHLGTVYQAMFDFVFAKKNNGQFIVRIEDTDRTRFVEGAEKVIFDCLNWFGLNPDEDPNKGGPHGPYRSSERLEIYKKYAEQLIESGNAYYCFCTKERLEQMRKDQEAQHLPPMYDKHCRNLPSEEVEQKRTEGAPAVVRLKVPENRKLKFHDSVVGDVEFDTNLVDDQVILKSDGFPTYHLAVIVDDTLMEITHVFRGMEWLPSVPKHILIYEFLGWSEKMPIFAHLPLILNNDGGGKLSKRHGHATVDYYRELGYLPEAVLNYLANIVWNHPEGKEIYDIMEFGKAFEENPFKIDVKPQGARFDLAKLDWVNGEWIRRISDEDLAKRLRDFLVDHPSLERLEELVPLIKERIKKLSDFIPLTAWIFEEIEYDKQFFDKTKVEDKAGVLQKILEKMNQLSRPWNKEEFEQTFQNLAKELGLNNTQMFQLIRVAVSGQLISPPIFESLQILGEDKTIERIKKAIDFLGS